MKKKAVKKQKAKNKFKSLKKRLKVLKKENAKTKTKKVKSSKSKRQTKESALSARENLRKHADEDIAATEEMASAIAEGIVEGEAPVSDATGHIPVLPETSATNDYEDNFEESYDDSDDDDEGLF